MALQRDLLQLSASSPFIIYINISSALRTFGSRGMRMLPSMRSCRSCKCCLCPPQREVEEVQADLEGSEHSEKLQEQAEVMEKA